MQANCSIYCKFFALPRRSTMKILLAIVTDGSNPISQAGANAALGKDSQHSVASRSKN